MVYVSDSDNSRVCVFTFEGKFVTSFGRCGEGPGEFSGLNGLTVDSADVLYVCIAGIIAFNISSFVVDFCA